MASKKHNPGCPCCDVCYDVTFTDDYSTFEIADGEFVPGVAPFPNPYWSLSESESLKSHEPPVGESWFHTVEISGGDLSPGERFDIEWDGITFQVRDLDGTITNGTNSSRFVAKASHPGGPVHYFITLWVTPSWYAVIVTPESPTNRGSVQTIDRDNTAASKAVKITAFTGALNIRSWRIADSTVKVTGEYMYGDITGECAKPNKLGFCTERFFDTQVVLLDSLSFTSSVDRYIHVVLFDPDRVECEYLDTELNNLMLVHPITGLAITTYGVASCGFAGLFAFDPEMIPKNPSPIVEISGSQFITLLASTPAVPYPKLVARYRCRLESAMSPATGFEGTCQSLVVSESQVDVVFGSDGKAAVQFNLELKGLVAVYFTCQDLESCGVGDSSLLTRIIEEVVTEWVAE